MIDIASGVRQMMALPEASRLFAMIETVCELAPRGAMYVAEGDPSADAACGMPATAAGAFAAGGAFGNDKDPMAGLRSQETTAGFPESSTASNVAA
jgi:hypothetical protein